MAKQNDKSWWSKEHESKKKTHAQDKMGIVMHEFKEGDLHSGRSGKIVKNRKQAIAIGLSYGTRQQGKK